MRLKGRLWEVEELGFVWRPVEDARLRMIVLDILVVLSLFARVVVHTWVREKCTTTGRPHDCWAGSIPPSWASGPLVRRDLCLGSVS
jgi:hypothetical protein